MLKNTIYITLLVTLIVPICRATSLDDACINSKVYASIKSLPLEYRPSLEKLKKFPYLDLDAIGHHSNVPVQRLDSWDPAHLKAKNFMVVMGLNFLDFTAEGFAQKFSGYLKLVNENEENQKSLYFAGLWYSLWLSASLVNLDKYPAVGTYGVILEIPPQLILKTYKVDSTTPIHSDLISRAERGENLNQFVRDYLAWDGGYPSEMSTITLDNGEVQMNCRRIFAEGESLDSPAFMTPEEMIKRGYPRAHNEIKFVPKGVYQGHKYRVKLSGIWYKDISFEKEMMSRTADEDTIIQLKKIAKDLNLDLIPLSQAGSTLPQL